MDYERIGSSPFYIVKAKIKPDFAHVLSVNSSYKLSNWHINSTQMTKAHEISKGKNNGIIAFIDSGTDLTNKAMQSNNFINHLEDINGNGILDSLDLNGIDDDGNGYIDDVSGYDFVDTKISNPNFDFNDIDPFPQDEFSFGHGSFVHDILNTFVPYSKKMVLRAADANGLLEEDDVAKAIIYAQENGAQVINLSFGSKNYSAFLEAVINYVTDLGVVIVAATGNEGRSELYYPARFQNVIAVGNLNEFNRRSSSSNYGKSLDLLAPGTNINALGLNQITHSVSGTSFASPIVASTVMLIKDIFPGLNLNQIRHHLRNTADDISLIGYDLETGAGKLNMFRAVSENTYNSISINYPVNQSFHNQLFSINITANGTHLSDSITVRAYSASETIYDESFVGMQFANENLFEFDASILSNGNYTIEILSGSEVYAESNFTVDHSIPVIDSLTADYIISNNTSNLFLEGSISKDVTLLVNDKLVLIKEDFFNILPFEDDFEDTLKLRFKDVNNLSLDYDLILPDDLEIKNHTQLITVTDLFDAKYIVSEHTTDIDSNGISEFWVYKSPNGIEIDSLHIFELNGIEIETKKKMRFPYLLRDSYYYLADNLTYALFSYSGVSSIQKIDENFNFSEEAEVVNKGLASKFIDISGNEKAEVLMRSTFKYNIYASNLSQSLIELPNQASQNAVLGIPNAQIQEKDGTYYIYFNDSEGHILTYSIQKNASANYLGFIQQSYPAGIQSLNVSNDKLYVLGEKVSASLFDDNQYDKSRRALDIFNIQNPNSANKLKTIYVQDQSLNANNASILSSNNQMAIHTGKNLFLIDSLFTVTRLLNDVENIYFATDLNKFIYSTDFNLKLAEYADRAIVFPTRYLVKNPSKNTFSVRIKSNRSFDRLYLKSESESGITIVDSLYSENIEQNFTISNQDKKRFTLSYLLDGNTYNYVISDYFPGFNLPLINSVDYLSDGLVLRSNSRLDINSIKTQTLKLSNSSYYAIKQINEYTLLLSSNDLANSDILTVENLTDAYGRAFSDTTINLTKSNEASTFYVYNYSVKDNKSIILEMNSAISNDLEIELLESGLKINFKVENNKITLTEENQFRAGEHYSFKIEDQTKIAYFGYRFKLDKANSILFPNPILVKEHQFITITNLKQYDHLRVFNFYGYKVYDKQFFDDLDAIRLNIDQDFKKPLASGIYFYVIEKTGKTIQNKFTVIR